MNYPILNQVNVPQEFGPFLNQHSGQVSTRNILAEPVRITNTRKGVITVVQTVRFRLDRRIESTSTYLPTVSVWDNITGEKAVPLPLIPTSNGFRVESPTWKVTHPVINETNGVESIGPCTQESGGIETIWTYPTNDTPARLTSKSKKTQYEFFMTNPFPTTWSIQEIKNAIENGLKDSCLWVIKRGMVLWFAVTPDRVVADVRRTNSSIRTVADLENATTVNRTFNTQPSDRLQNIFPKFSIEGNKLINTTIINGGDWKDKKNIKSSSGQTLEWKWVVGLFNDKEGESTLSNTVGPAIYDVIRSDWEFFDWEQVDEFTLVDSDTEIPRIDRTNKIIYFSSKRRTILTLQMRQSKTDKGEDYIGYTSLDGFYTDSLTWFIRNKLI